MTTLLSGGTDPNVRPIASDDALWREWRVLERRLEDLTPCFHREYRYSPRNECDWCQTHARMEAIERDMGRNARERMRCEGAP